MTGSNRKRGSLLEDRVISSTQVELAVTGELIPVLRIGHEFAALDGL